VKVTWAGSVSSSGRTQDSTGFLHLILVHKENCIKRGGVDVHPGDKFFGDADVIETTETIISTESKVTTEMLNGHGLHSLTNYKICCSDKRWERFLVGIYSIIELRRLLIHFWAICCLISKMKDIIIFNNKWYLFKTSLKILYNVHVLIVYSIDFQDSYLHHFLWRSKQHHSHWCYLWLIRCLIYV